MSDPRESPPRKGRAAGAAELIEQVRRRPCLWDRGCAAYRSRNRALKQQAWQDVCRALHDDHYDHLSAGEKHEIGIVMMRKWYNIRDTYKKSFSTKGAAAGRPYMYADQLTFLIPIFESRAKNESIKCENAEDNDHELEREEWLNVLELDQSEGPSPKRSKLTEYSQPKEPEYSQPKEPAEMDESLLSVLINVIEKEEDEDRAFFRSITPAVKSLSDEMKFIFRIRVMKLLNNMKKKNNKIYSESIAGDGDGSSDTE